jgi:diguanylate cyclase (GGDEF)-like protein
MFTLFRKLSSLFRLKRIGVRLALSYALLLTLFVLVTLLPFSQIKRMSKLGEEFTHHEMRRLLNVQALSLSIESVSNALLELLTAPREDRVTEYRKIDDKNHKISALITSIEPEINDGKQLQNLRELAARRNTYQNIYVDLVNQLEDEGQDAAKASYVKNLQPALTALLHESNVLLEYEEHLVQEQQKMAQSEFDKTSVIAISLSAFAVLLAAILAWLTTRSVVVPLSQLQASALRIAAGDYDSKVPDSQTEEVAKVAKALNSMASAIALREKEIEQLAYYDSITDLPNRTLLLKTFQQEPLTHHILMLMDLARLKTINETLGFDTGDSVIAAIAARIMQVISASNMPEAPFLAKMAGGAFALIFSAKDKTIAHDIYQRIEHAMSEPVRYDQYAVDISLVYGFAVAAETHVPLIRLIRNAEVALYAAKRNSRKSAWYSDAQEASRLSHLSLLSDLRSAVKASELQIWLQPKVRLSTLQIFGFEALVRWQHPERGFISPAEFIPFAEKAGYISIITQWILENAIIKLASWKTSYPDLSIAVNVSTDDLRDKQLPERVVSLLSRYGVAPHLLKLEITESGIMQDPESTIELLNRLRDTGISLSIDDFGTGYSSLAYLQKFPVKELKIDRSFVNDIDKQQTTQRLVKTIIEMGHGLHLQVVAEGVETQAERDILIQLGCDAMQGYLVSKPLHGNALQEWLENQAIH